jgi:hypothetical protein
MHVASRTRAGLLRRKSVCAVVDREKRITNTDYFLFVKFSLRAAFHVLLRKRTGTYTGHVTSVLPCQQEFILIVNIPVSFTPPHASQILQKNLLKVLFCMYILLFLCVIFLPSLTAHRIGEIKHQQQQMLSVIGLLSLKRTSPLTTESCPLF